MASVGDLQWRRGRRGSAGGRAAGAGSAARPDNSTGDVIGTDPGRAEAASEPRATRQSESPAIRIVSEPEPESEPGVSVDSAGPGRDAACEEQPQPQAPVAPPRRTGPTRRAQKGEAAESSGCSRPAEDSRCLGGAERENTGSHPTEAPGRSDSHTVAKDPPLHTFPSATTKIDEKTVQTPKSNDTFISITPEVELAIIDANIADLSKVNKENICQNDGERQRNKASTSDQQMKCPTEVQMISSAPDLDVSSSLNEDVNSALKSEIRPTVQSANNSSQPNEEHTALQKQQEAILVAKVTDLVEMQSGEQCSSSQNCVKPADDVTYQESQQLVDVPVRPPRHNVASKAAAATVINPAANSENVSNKPYVGAPALAQPSDEQPRDGALKIPETVNGGPKAVPEPPACLASAEPSTLVRLDSASPDGANHSDTHSCSSVPEVEATASERSNRQPSVFRAAANISIKTDQQDGEESEAIQTQVKGADVLAASLTDSKEETQEGHFIAQPIPAMSETDTEPIDFWLDAETSQLAGPTEIPKSHVSNLETTEPSASSSALAYSSETEQSRGDDFSYSEPVPVDSSNVFPDDQKASEQVTASHDFRDSDKLTSEPEHRLPVTTVTQNLTSTERPPALLTDQTSSSETGSKEFRDHDVTESSATADLSTSSESASSATSESVELRKVTRTSSASSCVSSSGSQVTDSSEPEQTSSVSEEPSGSSETSSSSPGPATVPMDCISSAASAHCPTDLASPIVEPASPAPRSDSDDLVDNCTKQESERSTSVITVTTAPPFAVGSDPATLMDTEPATPMDAEAPTPTGTEGLAPIDDSDVIGTSTSPSHIPDAPNMLSLYPVVDALSSSSESDSSSVCSECSTSESETSTFEADLKDSTDARSHIDAGLYPEPTTTGQYSEQTSPAESHHPPLAVGAACSQSEAAAAPLSGSHQPAPWDGPPAPAAATPVPASPPSAPEATTTDIPQPVIVAAVTASPKDRPKPVQRRSRVLQPPVEVQRQPSLTPSITGPARPVTADVTPPAAPPAGAALPPPAAVAGSAAAAGAEAVPTVVAPPRLRHRPPPTEDAELETPAMLARRQRRIRRTASSPEVGDRLVRLDGGGERPPVPRSPPPNMTPLRRRMVIAQQTQQPRWVPATGRQCL